MPVSTPVIVAPPLAANAPLNVPAPATRSPVKVTSVAVKVVAVRTPVMVALPAFKSSPIITFPTGTERAFVPGSALIVRRLSMVARAVSPILRSSAGGDAVIIVFPTIFAPPEVTFKVPPIVTLELVSNVPVAP